MSKRIYVGNLSFGTTEEGLLSVFSQFGQVVSAMVIRDRLTDQSRGFGFVEMELEDDAMEAIAALNGQMIDGRRVRVNAAEERGQGDRRERRRIFPGEGTFQRGDGGGFGRESRSRGFHSAGSRHEDGHRGPSSRPRRNSQGDSWDYAY